MAAWSTQSPRGLKAAESPRGLKQPQSAKIDHGRSTVAKKIADPAQLMDRMRDLEKKTQQADKEKRSEELLRKKELMAAKKRIQQEINSATKMVRKADAEVNKLGRMLKQCEQKTDQVQNKKHKQQEDADKQVQKFVGAHNGLEHQLSDRMAEVGEARGRLAHAEFAQRMLEMGAIVPLDGSQPNSSFPPLSPGSTRESGYPTAAPFSDRSEDRGSPASIGIDETIRENEKLARENDELRKQLEEVVDAQRQRQTQIRTSPMERVFPFVSDVKAAPEDRGTSRNSYSNVSSPASPASPVSTSVLTASAGGTSTSLVARATAGFSEVSSEMLQSLNSVKPLEVSSTQSNAAVSAGINGTRVSDTSSAAVAVRGLPSTIPTPQSAIIFRPPEPPAPVMPRAEREQQLKLDGSGMLQSQPRTAVRDLTPAFQHQPPVVEQPQQFLNLDGAGLVQSQPRTEVRDLSPAFQHRSFAANGVHRMISVADPSGHVFQVEDTSTPRVLSPWSRIPAAPGSVPVPPGPVSVQPSAVTWQGAVLPPSGLVYSPRPPSPSPFGQSMVWGGTSTPRAATLPGPNNVRVNTPRQVSAAPPQVQPPVYAAPSPVAAPWTVSSSVAAPWAIAGTAPSAPSRPTNVPMVMQPLRPAPLAMSAAVAAPAQVQWQRPGQAHVAEVAAPAQVQWQRHGQAPVQQQQPQPQQQQRQQQQPLAQGLMASYPQQALLVGNGQHPMEPVAAPVANGMQKAADGEQQDLSQSQRPPRSAERSASPFKGASGFAQAVRKVTAQALREYRDHHGAQERHAVL